MTTSAFAIVLLILTFAVAILGGLGVFGLGEDSRGLDPRDSSADRPGRSMLS
ncbi:MAG: hypothetical protein ABJA93_14320 [Sporichthyaceae bacterium]